MSQQPPQSPPPRAPRSPGASESSPQAASSRQLQHPFVVVSTMEDESDRPPDPPPPQPRSSPLGGHHEEDEGKDGVIPSHPLPLPRWYRSHFSCQEIGRYFPSTKRHLTWIVGYVSDDSHQRRCDNNEPVSSTSPLSGEVTPCEQEQELHRVELVWSVRSGKIRVLWDGNDITHLFAPASTKEQYERVLLSWDAPINAQQQHEDPPKDHHHAAGATTKSSSRSRVRISIEAHADYATDLRRRPQYDMTIDGQSYRTLPTKDELKEIAFRRHAAQHQQRITARRRRRSTEPTSTTTPSAAASPSSSSSSSSAAAVAAHPVDKNEPVETLPEEPRNDAIQPLPSDNDKSAAVPPPPSTTAEGAAAFEQQVSEAVGQSDLVADVGAIEAVAVTAADSNQGVDVIQDDSFISHVHGDVDELSDLGCGVGDDDEGEDSDDDNGNCVVLAGAEEDEKEESYCVTPVASTDFDFRLSMVGLKHANSSENNSSTDLVVDELRSDLYSPMLETLRLRITDHLPQLEDVVSKAIIHAFFVDNESSQHSCSGGSTSIHQFVPQHIHPDLRRCSSGSSTLASGSNHQNSSNNNHHSCRRSTTVQLEMDTLKAAHEFVATLSKKVDEVDAESRSDVEEDEDDDDNDNDDDGYSLMDRRLDFMQSQIDTIFCLVRNDEIVPSQAARILLRVACVLGLNFARPIPTNTVLLTSLDEAATARDVAKALSQFGEVVVTAVAPGGYGLGRFRDSAAALRVETNRESLLVKGQVPCVAVITSSVTNAASDQAGALPLDETGHSSDAEDDLRTDPPPRPESPQVTIPHLMALGEYNISFVASSNAVSSSSSSSLVATSAPNKPRPISEATTSSGSSSTQATMAMTESSFSMHHSALAWMASWP